MATTAKTKAELDHDAKWKLTAQRAQRTATWAKTMTKVLITQSHGKQPRWHVVNFVGPNRGECRGIVDLLAIRKSHQRPNAPLNRGDLFEVVLIQVKGGKARWPSAEDRVRLRLVGQVYQASAILLSEWKKGATPTIYRLNGDDWGIPIDPAEVFASNGTRSPVKPARKRPPRRVDAIPSAQSHVATASSDVQNTRSNAAKKAWVKRRAATTGQSKT